MIARILRILPVVAVGCLLPALLKAREPGIRVHLVGGTVASVPDKADGRIEMSAEENLLLHFPTGTLGIPYLKINTLEYGQNVNRRYAEALLISPLLLLSKSRKHFVTVGYLDEDGRQQALIFRLDKRDVRAVLAGLEAKTGRRVEYQDDEARKAGKG